MGSSPNLIQVGAVFNGAQFDAAIKQATANVEQQLQQMTAAFQKLQAESSAAIAALEVRIAELEEKIRHHSARSSEAMHAMGLSAEATGVTINRHLRTVINELPILSKAFEVAFPAFAAIAMIEVLKHFGEKLSEVISDTFIFTEAEKEQDKALKASNVTLEKMAERVKQLGRETQIAAEQSAVGKEKLRLQFALEDLGGDPAALREKLRETISEVTRARAEVQRLSSGPEFERPEAFVQRMKQMDEAKAKVAELENTINQYSAAIKVAEAETAKTGQTIKNDLTAEFEKTRKELDAFVQHVLHNRGALTTAVKKMAEDQAQAEIDANKALAEAEEKRIAKILEAEKKLAEDRIRAAEIGAEAAKVHEEAIGEIAQQRLQFELQIGKLTEAAYEKQLARQLAATYAEARKELELKRALAQGNIVEQARVDSELKKLDDKYRADTERADQQHFLRRRQQFDNYFKTISQSFNTALNSWIAGTETASQAFSQMFQQIIIGLIGFVEQWIEKKIEMWLIDKILGDQGQQAQVANTAASNAAIAMSDAFVASANAYAPLAWNPAAAAAAAAEAFAIVGGFALGAGSAAVFHKGGIVPQDGLILAEAGERVLPKSMSGDGNFGMPAFTFAPTIQAFDAEGVDRILTKHRKKFTDHFFKEAKKKGWTK